MTPRWRLFVWVLGTDLALYALATLLNPGPLYFYPGLANPWGVDGTELLQAVMEVTSPALFGSLLVGVIALVLRFRRATGVERLQLKWLVWAGSAWAVLTPAMIWIGEQDDGRVAGVLVGDVVFSLVLVLVPVAVGVSILRYRLYDIDLVVNRTLVYGALTLTLAAAYLGSVLLFRVVLSPLTGESDVAVAGSTLAVAALFRPFRSRIQSLVDRQFDRSRYNAARTLESFSGRLREQLDLEAVGTDLRQVVHDTVHPAHVSLWLREASR